MKHSGVAEADAVELSAPKIAIEPMRMANLRVATVLFYSAVVNRTPAGGISTWLGGSWEVTLSP
jgi:hypothetical protein